MPKVMPKKKQLQGQALEEAKGNLKKNINLALRECKSAPGWRFCTTNNTDIEYMKGSKVVSPEPQIPYSLEESSVPEVIRNIVTRQYELAHYGTSDIVIKDKAAQELEAIAA